MTDKKQFQFQENGRARIKDMPAHERPREKMVERGASGLKDKELLAILLRTGRQGRNVIAIADSILKKQTMPKLLALDLQTLAKVDGIGLDKACTLVAAFELTKRALAVEDNSLPLISSALDAIAQMPELRTAKKEHFVVIYLDARNRLIHKETISIGTLNANLVHPREVFKPAIDHLAASIIVSHNHPSGCLEPSAADLELTQRLTDAGRLLGIELIDHLIITKNGYTQI